MACACACRHKENESFGTYFEEHNLRKKIEREGWLPKSNGIQVTNAPEFAPVLC
jgi:hypothetical protein